MKKTIILIIAASLFLTFQHKNNSYSMDKKSTFQVSILAEKFAPFSYLDKNGKITGYSKDIVQYIIKDTKTKVKTWQIVPWTRGYSMALNNENVFLYTVVRKTDREKLFHWIGPISDRNIYIYTLKKNKKISINSFNDAKKYRVAVVRRSASADLCASKGIQAFETRDDEQSVKLLLNNRVDVIIILESSAAYEAKKFNKSISDFKKLFLLDGSKKYYIVISKKTNIKLVKAFQNSFKKMKRNGSLKKLKKKYFQ